MSWRTTSRLCCALAGCCLLTAASGCQFHRTGHGFIICGQRGSLEYSRDCAAAYADEVCATDSQAIASSAKQPADRPELLPWRMRQKAHRLAALLAHREKSNDEESPNEVVARASTDSKGSNHWPAPPEPLPIPPTEATVVKPWTPPRKDSVKQVATEDAPLPEPKRPDLVLE